LILRTNPKSNPDLGAFFCQYSNNAGPVVGGVRPFVAKCCVVALMLCEILSAGSAASALSIDVCASEMRFASNMQELDLYDAHHL
jgi:hypothetical protein